MTKMSEKRISKITDEVYDALLAHRKKGLETTVHEIMRPVLFKNRYADLSASERNRVFQAVKCGVISKIKGPPMRPTGTTQLPLI
jgi:hypothetical protein